MEYVKDLVQYFDELYPVTDAQKKFYDEILKSKPKPAKILSIGSSSGTLEFFLAKQGCDVTGIENFPPLLESANLKRRNQLLSIRFFTLPDDQLSRFLAKGFYDVVNILRNRVCYNSSRQKVLKLLLDVRSLVKEGGSVVIQFVNFENLVRNSSMELPVRASTRAKLFSSISNRDGDTSISMMLQIWNEKTYPIFQARPIYPMTRDEMCRLAKEAGFKNAEFYSDIEKNPFAEDSLEIVSILS